MKKLILISALLLFASNGWAYNETDLAKLRALNACEACVCILDAIQPVIVSSSADMRMSFFTF